MKIERLITARPVESNFHVSGEPTVSFISRPFKSSLGIPPYYAIAQRSNGAVDRFEYSSVEEFRNHQRATLAAVATVHEQTGVRLGCHCSYCRKATGMDAVTLPGYHD